MTSSECVLEMRNICKNFPGVKALDDVTLNVVPGRVHAIVGENGAGKSTLMKCVFGIYAADGGEVILNGQPVSFANTKQALDAGIAMIQQELLPIPERNVMDNFWLGRFPQRNYGIVKIVDEKKMYVDCKAVLDDLKIDIDPATKVANLSASKIQLMEIAQAVSYHSKVIIMDEPTSSLTENEVEHLFAIIRRLRDQGIAIVYISHRMEEIFEISDEVTIMRDGRCIGTYPTSEITSEFVIKQMVGRTLTNMFPPRENIPSDVVLKVENLTSISEHSFKDVTFEVRKGEIFGIGGLVGAQRSELVEALFGLRGVRSGTVRIDGKKVVITNPIQAKHYKIALLTEERRATGIFPVLSVLDNTLMASIGRYVRKSGLVDQKRAATDVQREIEMLKVKTPSLTTHLEYLSGGNQQKVIVARWLMTEPDILILDEPTRGIDVGAKYELYSIIAELAKSGKTIIMISSEMPELIGMSDRIMVMCEGRVTGILQGKEATQEAIMTLATQLM
ncbi:MAG: sugar ABC transporter ATP-binding protein [Caldiserica bacterium]|nr:sugar ABC transporter ATP-binding protein [Caldisericota bacterium]